MTKWFSRAILIIFVCSVLGLVAVTLLLGSRQRQNRVEYRRAGLEQLMEAIKVQTAVQKNYLPLGINYEWQQIGTATDGCELNTSTCQATSSSCLNWNHILRDVKQLSLPADIKDGGMLRTGYAVKFEEPDKVWVAACGSEASSDMVLSHQIPGVIFNQVYSEATDEAELSNLPATKSGKLNEK